jgi:hypothetical protein
MCAVPGSSRFSAATANPVARSRFRGNPYLFLGPRPFREARLRSYIVSQHRAGRRLASILGDPYVRRCGSESFCWRVVRDPRTIEALRHDVREAIERCSPQSSNAAQPASAKATPAVAATDAQTKKR